MMALSDGRKSIRIRFAVLIPYRSVTDTQPATQPRCRSYYAQRLILAKASSLKIRKSKLVKTKEDAGHKFTTHCLLTMLVKFAPRVIESA